MSFAAPYSAQKVSEDGIEIIQLDDEKAKTRVSIAPSLGNIAFRMMVNGKNVFWNPYESVAEFRAKPVLLGNPFLAPWANRLDHDGFFAGGKEYRLNPELNNIRRDGNGKPIHGLVLFTPFWQVVEVKSDGKSAWVTSRLEFWKHPEFIQQFPFAHSIEMTYRLSGGTLQVETALHNLSAEPMPVVIGFHPYFQLHDAPRNEWKVTLAARDQMLLSQVLIPTGELRPNPYQNPVVLDGTALDDVFTNLSRGSNGHAEFSVEGKREKLVVSYGPKFPVAVVYSPKDRDFICFEPMTGPTNGFNLAHDGIYKDLQTVAPGETWRESYWIRPSGF